MDVSVVIPAFNEESAVGATLHDILMAMKSCVYGWEVIVVDDGSSDRTSVVSASLATVTLRHATNQGKASAMRTGIAAASGKYVVFVDADGTYPGEDVRSLCDVLVKKSFDAVFSARQQEHIKPLNRIGNAIFKVLTRKLSHFQGTDPLSGLFGARTSLLEGISLESDRFAIESEIVFKIGVSGVPHTEIPIAYNPRIGSSKLQPLRDGWKILSQISYLAVLYRPGSLFGLPGLVLAFLGIALQLASAIHGSSLGMGSKAFLAGTMLTVAGFGIVEFSVLGELYAIAHHFKASIRLMKYFVRTKVLRAISFFALALTTASVIGIIIVIRVWALHHFSLYSDTLLWMSSLGGALLGGMTLVFGFVARALARAAFRVMTDQPLAVRVDEPVNRHA